MCRKSWKRKSTIPAFSQALLNTRLSISEIGLPVERVNTHCPPFCLRLRSKLRASAFKGKDLALPDFALHSYQRTRLNRFGFPRGYLTRQKQIHGFQTGDRVKAVVTQGKKIGTYVGRVAVRASGSFNIQTAQSLIQGISYRYCTLIQRGDGYGYSLRTDSN